MRSLVWFRSDLRTSDNPALHRAAADSTRGVVACFIISPEEWRAHDFAPAKVDLILRTLSCLSADLAALNIPLLITTCQRRADIPVTLLSLAKSHGCDALHFNREYEWNERRRDDGVSAAFSGESIRVATYTDQAVLEPGDVRTGEGRWYTVFTPFKNAVIKELDRRGGVTTLPVPPKQPATGIASSPIPESIPGFESDIPASLWPAGESHAQQRLRSFVELRIRAYKHDRDFPALDATSAISPYLTVGAISPRQCIAAAAEANGPSPAPSLGAGQPGVVHWISEVLWREFYTHILVGFPRVCMHRAFQPATEAIRWSGNDAHFEAWCKGRTGVPIVDAAMRQLLATGWMHNRCRMIAAMYLTKNLFIDWRRGEQWFMRHLVDGYLASNNGGWQWSASTGTDAAPYFRIFNPVSQSRKFDENGEYIRRYVPELASVDDATVHAPWELPILLRGTLDYPEPLVDLSASRDAAIKAFQALKA
jgi:deoxyribodipyrimidine photo-lyase